MAKIAIPPRIKIRGLLAEFFMNIEIRTILDLNIKNYDKVISKFKVNSPQIGQKIRWYYKEDADFWKKEGIKKEPNYEGILVPMDDSEVRSSILDYPDNIAVVIYKYPCEKHYPNAAWVSLWEILANPDLVEIISFDNQNA